MNEPGEARRRMLLRILLPTRVLVDEPVVRVLAEGHDGAFCLLPRHIDFVSALVPGILTFQAAEGRERYAAIDRGILVKCDDRVSVSCLGGVLGERLEDLRELVEQRFVAMDEHERKSRSALARLELGTLRAFQLLREGPLG